MATDRSDSESETPIKARYASQQKKPEPFAAALSHLPSSQVAVHDLDKQSEASAGLLCSASATLGEHTSTVATTENQSSGARVSEDDAFVIKDLDSGKHYNIQEVHLHCMQTGYAIGLHHDVGFAVTLHCYVQLSCKCICLMALVGHMQLKGA